MGKLAIITGGARGIGKEISLTLAKNGFSIGAISRDKDSLQQLQIEITKIGGKVATSVCDVQDYQQIKKSIDKFVEELGLPYLIVCNSGISGPTKACENIETYEWHETISTNLTGAFYSIKASIPFLKSAGKGRIIFISSTTGKNPVSNRTPYAASKMALIGLSRSLAEELGNSSITVNTICPGVVNGDRWNSVLDNFSKVTGESKKVVEQKYLEKCSVKKFSEAHHIASLVLYLSSEAADTITGQDLNVCSGLISN